MPGTQRPVLDADCKFRRCDWTNHHADRVTSIRGSRICERDGLSTSAHRREPASVQNTNDDGWNAGVKAGHAQPHRAAGDVDANNIGFFLIPNGANDFRARR